LTDAVDDLGRNRLFKSGAAGSNGEDADGIYTLNMRGLSKALIGLNSTKERQDQDYSSPRNHKEYNGSLNSGSGESFSYTIEFGRGGSQTMGETGLTTTQILTGGGSDDIINGGSGDDIIAGNRGSDIIKAGAGKDFVEGGAGSDVIDGGDGNDYLVGDYADSDRHESRAEDRDSETWNDLIRGGAGDDFIFGNQGNDTLQGNDGNDVMGGGGQAKIVSSMTAMATNFSKGGQAETIYSSARASIWLTEAKAAATTQMLTAQLCRAA
jgi:Ca2+-binding RTX toxin-like protein